MKGLDYFIDMAKYVKKIIPGVKFMIIGDTSEKNQEYKKSLLKKIHNMGLVNEIIFTGHQKNVKRILSILDISILCSDLEGLPLSLVESLISNKPVIATEISGIPEIIIHNKTGLLVPPRDSQAMANAVISLLNDPVRASKLAENGRGLVLSKFKLDTHGQSILKVYKKCLLK